MPRREHREKDNADPSYPISGVSAFSRDSARPGGSSYQPMLRAQETSARVLIPITIAKLRQMADRMSRGSPEFQKRMKPSFEEKKSFLTRLIKEAGVAS
jgi:hypothetical protein